MATSERKYFEQTTQSFRSDPKVPVVQYTIAPVPRADGVDDESKVIVDLGAEVSPSTSAPSVVKHPTAPVRHTGSWVVVLAYVIAATALGLAIYERFLR